MVILKILFKPVSMMCRSDLRKREPTEKKQFLLPGQGEEEVYSHTNPPKVFIALHLQNMIIVMLVLNVIEVLNQSMIKYLGADDLAHTQLDPQWSHGGAGDGRS